MDGVSSFLTLTAGMKKVKSVKGKSAEGKSVLLEFHSLIDTKSNNKKNTEWKWKEKMKNIECDFAEKTLEIQNCFYYTYLVCNRCFNKRSVIKFDESKYDFNEPVLFTILPHLMEDCISTRLAIKKWNQATYNAK